MPPPAFVRRLYRRFLRSTGYLARQDQKWERSVSVDPAALDAVDDGLPMPPPYYITLVAGGPSQRWFSEHGRRHADMIVRLADEAGLDLFGGLEVLDLGCGCGRIARWLAPRIEAAGGSLLGLDIQPALVAWCAENLPGRYLTSRLGRGLPVSSVSVDLLYAYSVATHLTRQSLQRLLADIARVLKPGGVALVTFQDERFKAADYAGVLAREGYAISSPRSEGRNHMSAWATHDAFAAIAREHFGSVRTIPSDEANGQQAVAVLKKHS